MSVPVRPPPPRDRTSIRIRRRRRPSPTSLPRAAVLVHSALPQAPSSSDRALPRAALAAAAGAARLLRGRLRLRRSPGSGSVQWFIGDDDDKPHERDKGTAAAAHGRVVREGVEFYSNGDCYEGEFHKGRCNGSGVYNFFGKGLRHGHGVYRFYSGDCYAGEWAGGQSHGIGAQTCSDGSSYVGEFKCGVKHGLGSYHFRVVKGNNLSVRGPDDRGSTTTRSESVESSDEREPLEIGLELAIFVFENGSVSSPSPSV